MLRPKNNHHPPTLLALYNPTSGRYHPKWLSRLAIACQKTNYTLETQPTRIDATGNLMINWPDPLPKAIWILGGDGTLRTVITAMIQAACCQIPIGLIPLGTCNVLAHELGITRTHTNDYVRLLNHWKTRALDVGLCHDTPFIMCWSTGIDAHIVHTTSLRLKKWLGRYAYMIALLRLMNQITPREPVSITTPTHTYTGTGIIIANTSHYAGPFKLTNGTVSDGQLDAVIHSFRSRFDWCLFLGLLLLHQAHRHPRCQFVSLTSGQLHTTQPQQIDGDPIPTSKTSLTLRIHNEPLHILCSTTP